MEQANDSTGRLIYAYMALPGNYWCSECNEKTHLRGGLGRSMRPHFYHYRYNPKCSECIDERFDADWMRFPKSERCIQFLESNDYKARWNESIEGLYAHGHLEWLYRKQYAINPIRNYLESGRFRTDESLLKALALVVFSFTTLDVVDLALQLHDWSFDWDTDKERIKLSCWLFDRFLEVEVQNWTQVLAECGVTFFEFIGQMEKSVPFLGSKNKQCLTFLGKIKINAPTEAESELTSLESELVRNGLIAPS